MEKAKLDTEELDEVAGGQTIGDMTTNITVEMLIQAAEMINTAAEAEDSVAP